MNHAMSQTSPAPDSPPDLPPPPARFAIVDIARGVALLAMFVFHFAYDLAHFRLIDTDIPFEPGWRLFARMIAGSFLTLVGISLVLATRRGLDRRSYARRLAMVAGAAALVTIGTRIAMPENFIFFGILHHIALASVLALPFLRLPVAALAACAAIVFALPSFVAADWLDAPWLTWLGFSRAPLYTADFVPVFPWFGCVLTGMALAKLALPRLSETRLARWRPSWLPTRIVAWGGRHSLLVYLVHQPVLIGLLMLAMQAGLSPIPEEGPFLSSCRSGCARPDLTAETCERFCSCTVDSLKRASLWRKVLANDLSPAETERMTGLARACFASQPARP